MAGLAATTLHPEDEIAHYRIVGPLGAGGMGEVYLARDASLERNVALKILPPELVRNEERLRRFVREARSASSLSHPNIVAIYEIGSAVVRSGAESTGDPVHYISMELVGGKTLATLIHEDRTDLRTLLGYLAQAAEGLAKAHAAGIVHRDLKPGNVMVTTDGYAKVLDFGLAKLTEKPEAGPESSAAVTLPADATGEGIVVGTTGYMSPEQIQGKTVDARSDIFSFGCMIYEAATRRRPFAGETTIETMHRILNDKPAPVEELNPKAPAELRRLIRRCLAKLPDQRLQSMKDVALELREIADEYESLSASASSGGSGSATVAAAAPRSTVAWRWAIAGAVAVAALGAWFMRSRAPGSQPFQTMEMAPVTNRGDVTDCVLSADGRYLAYLAGFTDPRSLRVRQIATGSDVEVAPATAGIESPAFSPDGNYLFYLARKPDAQNYRVLEQVPSLGGTPQQRVFDVDSRVSFSPDGRQIVFWRGYTPKQENRLMVVDLASGHERQLATVPNIEYPGGGPVWSPDGKRIAAALLEALGRPRSVVACFDAASGQRRDVITLPFGQIRDLAWLKDGAALAATAWASLSSNDSQVLLIAYPSGRVQHVTNDLSEYRSVSVSADAAALAAVRLTRLENVWIADPRGGAARQITNITNYEYSPFGIAAVDSGTIVYSAAQGQGVQLWAQGVSGGPARPLTPDATLSFNAASGGGRILFDRIETEGIHVWTVNPDGTGLRALTSGTGEQTGGVSPDGRYAGIRRYDSPGAPRVLDLTSGRERELARGITGSAGVSPDGRRVLASHDERGEDGLIHVEWLAYPLAGGGPSDSLLQPGHSRRLVWSPDSRGILYIDAADPRGNVYRLDFGASAPVQLTHFTDGAVLQVAPAPDGKHFAVTRQVGDGQNVWVCDPDGSHPVQVTNLPHLRVLEMAWLADGRRLAVGAGTLSSDAVLVRNFR